MQDNIMSEGGDGVIEELCGDEKALNETQVMVNIIVIDRQPPRTVYWTTKDQSHQRQRHHNHKK